MARRGRLSAPTKTASSFTATAWTQPTGISGFGIGLHWAQELTLLLSGWLVMFGVSYGIKFINQDQYNGIAVKTSTSTFPQVIFVNNTFPDVEMYVYPRPTQDLEWHFISVQELTQPATLSTELHFPPGYMRAFAYNLAMEIAPEFGVEPSPQVQRIAMTSKRNLKRINNPYDVMSLPYAVVANRQRFNIYAGNF